jgi:WD40 repeat protein
MVAADTLFTSPGDSRVRVWRVSGWRRVADLPHEWSLRAMAFSPDGRWLTTVTNEASRDAADPGATALVGSTVRVWNVRERRLVTLESLAAHGGISSVAFSEDGRWLAATSEDYASAGDPETGEGASEDRSTTLRLWQLAPDDLVRTACASLRRNLSNSEWDTFIGTRPRRLTCPGLSLPPE